MKITNRISIKCGKGLGILVLLASLAILVPTVPSLSAPVRIQPILTQMAAEQPEATISIIVQKSVKDNSVEEMVARLGGKVTTDLSIINAFAAEMPANAIQQLAQTDSVRYISLDATINSTACTQCMDTTNLTNVYIKAIRADQIWNNAPYLQGEGIGVAIVDSGINPNGDLYTSAGVNRQVADVRFNSDVNQSTSDGYGHGTVVSSIVAGDGSDSGGTYIGVAPMANIINVKVSNDNGSAAIKDVVSGLQWVLNNHDKYNIRVVNLSLNSSVDESYLTSPLDAAVEILWFNRIVVVTSAGNTGKKTIYPPANDPFVITVGATDDKGTISLADDDLASFSGYGKTSDGFVKPDLVAPGKNIVGRMVNTNMGLAQAHPSNVISSTYFRMSGTSVAAPMVSGAVALLLQDEPTLTPDQVKYRLMETANKKGYSASKAGAGLLDVYAAVRGTTTQKSNTGIALSNLLKTGPIGVTGSAVSWDSVSWDSVSWDSVSWDSVSWDSVSWDSDYWGP